VQDDQELTPTTGPPRQIASAADDCACVTPLPVQKAERKGVARTCCARCGRPIPLRFTPPPRGWL
jgi:hypothetical protein